jgi:hypothetical protein
MRLIAAIAALTASASLTATPSTVHRGHIVVLSGNAGGCPVGDSVTIISHAFRSPPEFAGVPAVFAKVRANGHFSVSTRIPATKAPGRYSITARCGGGNFGVLVRLRVLR